MGGKTEIVRGRIKEDAGALTGNNTSREEGQADQMVGRARKSPSLPSTKPRKWLGMRSTHYEVSP